MDAFAVVARVEAGERCLKLVQIPNGMPVQEAAQDGVEAFHMAVLLWSIGVGEDLIQMVLLEIVLHHGCDELRTVVVAHLHMQVALQQIGRLQVVLDHLVPGVLDLIRRTADAHSCLPVQGLPREGVQYGKDVAVASFTGDPLALDVHLQHVLG